MSPVLLQALILAIQTQIATINLSSLVTYSIDGQSVSGGDYLKMLTDLLEKYNNLLLASQPYEFRSNVL